MSYTWSLLQFSPVAAWRWEWRSVLVWRAVLVRFEVVEVVGVLCRCLVSMTSTAGDMPCFGGLLTWWSAEAWQVVANRAEA